MALRIQGECARSAKKGKEDMMAVSIKKAVWTIVLVVALLIALVGWSLRAAAVSGAAAPHHSGLHNSSHLIVGDDGDNDADDGGTGDVDDITCPPPPRMC